MKSYAILRIIKLNNDDESFIKVSIIRHTVDKKYAHQRKRKFNSTYNIKVLKEIKGELNYIKKLEKDIHMQLIKYTFSPLHRIDYYSTEYFEFEAFKNIDYNVAEINPKLINKIIKENLQYINTQGFSGYGYYPFPNGYTLRKPEHYTLVASVSITTKDLEINPTLSEKCKNLEYLLNYVPPRLIKFIDEGKAFIWSTLISTFYIFVFLDNPDQRANLRGYEGAGTGIDENGRLYW